MDGARIQTDHMLTSMQGTMGMEYSEAADSLADDMYSYAQSVAVDGRIPESAFSGPDWNRARDGMASTMVGTNRHMAADIAGRTDDVRDMTAYGSTRQSAVPHPSLDVRRDTTWNRRKVDSMARVCDGKTPAEAASHMRGLSDMNYRSMMRQARTAINGAENAGRMDHMLERGGYKRWVAVMDERTRASHASLNGTVIPVDEKFENGLMYPGDPVGDPAEIYNCRCILEWVDADEVQDMSMYDDQLSTIPVDGENILGTWQRRPDQFDFEIEDVLDAQGFDRLPRVVGSDEFDKAVKAANNGNGLVMQRAYTAPNQEVLDAYRDQLYHGKWYVDCSTGGAQYGQGMYAAADYSGVMSQGIRDEMQHYIGIGQERLGTGVRYADLSADRRSAIMDSMLDKYYPEASAVNRAAMRDMANDTLGVPTDRTFFVAKRSMEDGFRTGDQWNHFMYELDRYSEGGAVSYIETMTLDPNARIIKYSELTTQEGRYRAVISSHNYTDEEKDYLLYANGVSKGQETRRGKAFEKSDPVRADELYRESRDITDQVLAYNDMDAGSWAASLGYDAINAEGHGASGSYTVILNRTRLIIRRPD